MGLLLAGHWHHNLNPFAIRFPEGFPLPGIRWYGLAYLAGFLAAWLLLKWLSRRERLGGVRPFEIADLVFWSAVGAIVGGRLGYSLLYCFQATMQQPWTILEVWQGGMASHGGIVGVAVASIVWWAHRLARPPGVGIPGEEIPGEPGRNEAAAGPRAGKQRLTRAQPRKQGHTKTGTELPSSWLARVGITLRAPGFWRMVDGVVAVSPVGLFFGRMANFVNGELWGRPAEVPWAVVFPDSPPPLVPRHPSALYEAALEGIFLFLWLFPGVLRGQWRHGGGTARFVIGYAAVRFLVEFVREPDEAIGYQWLNLTRGQWLSLVLAALGFVMLRWVATIGRKANQL